MTFVLGIVAALAAPLTMTVGFIVWDNHWTGSAFALNMFKCNLASIGFVVLSLSTRGSDIFPSEIFTPESVGFLVLSSTIGIIIGDWTWLEGLRLLGARKVIVMDSLKPFLAAVFGWLFLDEELQIASLGGIVLTVFGILLVSLEVEQDTSESSKEGTGENKQQNSKDQKFSSANTPTDEADVSAQSDSNFPVVDQLVTQSLVTGSFQQSHDKETILIDETTSPESQDVELQLKPFTAESEPQPEQEDVRKAPETNSSKRAKTRLQLQSGYLFAILNVLLDTYGSVLTKQYGEDMTTWEINLIRFGFAAIFMLLCSLTLSFRNHGLKPGHNEGRGVGSNNSEGGTSSVPSNQAISPAISPEEQVNENAGELWYKLPLEAMTKSSWMHVSAGVLFVTFFTPALSNYALFQIALALALTLGSAGPLYALPLTFIMQKNQRRPTMQSMAGATLAVAGIVVLAFWGQSE